MTGVDVVNVLIPKLLDMGIIVHRYNAYSTSSIYLLVVFVLQTIQERKSIVIDLI